MENQRSLAIIGGTGKEGNAIAARFAKAGVRVKALAVLAVARGSSFTAVAEMFASDRRYVTSRAGSFSREPLPPKASMPIVFSAITRGSTSVTPSSLKNFTQGCRPASSEAISNVVLGTAPIFTPFPEAI